MIEIYIIETTKYKKGSNNSELDKWLEFLINPGVVDVMKEENKATKAIAKKLKEEKIDVEIICKATGLTKEEVEKL